jgi:hypothetical protein
MWSSNSVIAWLLAQNGLANDTIHPPAGGRAPGWQPALAVADRCRFTTTEGHPHKGT